MRAAIYKGKKYRLDYLGRTKFGYRAKLAFFNGAKTFWVPGEAVREIFNSAVPARRFDYAKASARIDRAINSDYGPGWEHPEPPPYEDEFDTYAEEAAAEQRNARIIDNGYDAYAREEGHYDTGDISF